MAFDTPASDRVCKTPGAFFDFWFHQGDAFRAQLLIRTDKPVHLTSEQFQELENALHDAAENVLGKYWPN